MSRSEDEDGGVTSDRLASAGLTIRSRGSGRGERTGDGGLTEVRNSIRVLIKMFYGGQ